MSDDGPSTLFPSVPTTTRETPLTPLEHTVRRITFKSPMAENFPPTRTPNLRASPFASVTRGHTRQGWGDPVGSLSDEGGDEVSEGASQGSIVDTRTPGRKEFDIGRNVRVSSWERDMGEGREQTEWTPGRVDLGIPRAVVQSVPSSLKKTQRKIRDLQRKCR
eukprot:549694-Amorphochlora_amoeboformis.AAC.1